jgi:hypothetical protein
MQVDPRTSFEFGVIDKGTYRFKIKETNIDQPKEGAKSGKRYWARCIVQGGDQDGESHIEGFFEITKDDFSFAKLAGFMLKIGMLPVTGKVDTDIFRTREFEERWTKQVPGREFGAKIGHRTKDKDGKVMDNPQSEMKVYYSLDEYLKLAGTVATPPAAAPSAAPAAPPAPPAAGSIWG